MITDQVSYTSNIKLLLFVLFDGRISVITTVQLCITVYKQKLWKTDSVQVKKQDKGEGQSQDVLEPASSGQQWHYTLR